jgi:hypothetical protein
VTNVAALGWPRRTVFLVIMYVSSPLRVHHMEPGFSAGTDVYWYMGIMWFHLPAKVIYLMM